MYPIQIFGHISSVYCASSTTLGPFTYTGTLSAPQIVVYNCFYRNPPFEALDMSDIKRTTLTIGERLQVLNDLKTMRVSKVAKKYNVHTRTIARIRKDASRVMGFANKGAMQHERRRVRPSLYEKMEKNLEAWFLERKTFGDFITNAMLIEKAKELKDSMELSSNFKVSKGWLDGFKKRCNIHVDKVYGESTYIDEDIAKNFCDNFIELLNENEHIDEDNIYNMNDTGLLWKALPSKTSVEWKEKVKEYRSRKERIVVALCANASGTHKLDPLVINKYENPRALEHCDGNLPVILKSQTTTWMMQNVFCDWYENHFKPSVRAHQSVNGVPGKVVLLLANSGGCKIPPQLSDEPDFKIIYLPPYTASLIQPMDQGIIVKLKTLYRHKVIRNATKFQGELSEFQEKLTLTDCITVLHESWTEISADNIIDAWKKLIPNQSNPYHRAIRQGISNATGTLYTEEDVAQFMTNCEVEERRKPIKEEEYSEVEEYEEENTEGEGVEDVNVQVEETKEEDELHYLFNRLEQHISQDEPFTKDIFKSLKKHLLGTDDEL